MLLWLWCRPAATAQIRPLAWELLYAAGAALTTKQNKIGREKIYQDLIAKDNRTQSKDRKATVTRVQKSSEIIPSVEGDE